jgi:AcrR family transcriptional regulator
MMDTAKAPDPGKPRYHHGDLRGALIRAAEAELTESGIEAFSLRSVAKRAGVSHAAPAHHFGDAKGLLTALAAEGYRRFLAMQKAREALAPEDARERFIASGLGYIDFALSSPALFRLMFSSDRPDFTVDELVVPARDAYLNLAGHIWGLTGRDARTDPVAAADLAANWAMAHGLADLLASGRLKPVADLPEAGRDRVLRAIIGRVVPEA